MATNSAQEPILVIKQPLPLDPEAQLAKFREEWKAEVRQRRALARGQHQPVDGSSSAAPHHQQAAEPPSVSPTPSVKGKEPTVSVTRAIQETAKHPPKHPVTHPQSQGVVRLELLPNQRDALEVYHQAIACEQCGQLDEALLLYRRAFRLADNVDRIHTQLEKIQSRSQLQQRIHSRSKSSEQAPVVIPKGGGVDHITHSLGHASLDAHVKPTAVVHMTSGNITGILAKLVENWGHPLSFLPEEGREREPVHLARIPDEVLLHILLNLDVASVERFASVSQKARMITLDSSIWRKYVEEIYEPPQINPEEDIPSLLEGYLFDYRRMFMEHPRVRLDGVYIAILHYTRRGLSENLWVNVNHLITYHRYLRFYPDGTVLSLLTTEDVTPQQVIPIFKPSLRMKGLFVGNWRLSGTTVFVTDLTNPAPPGPDPPKYTFQMTLELKSRPTGRWNRLNFITYDSVAVKDGEVSPLQVKHDRPFWFSKVKSYGRL